MLKKSKTAKASSIKMMKTAVAKVGPNPAAKQVLVKGTKLLPPPLTRGTAQRNSKQAQLIEMLKRSNGVTIPQIMDVTGWQQHSVRGFLSGTIKKKLSLTVVSEKKSSGERIYRIKAA